MGFKIKQSDVPLKFPKIRPEDIRLCDRIVVTVDENNLKKFEYKYTGSLEYRDMREKSWCVMDNISMYERPMTQSNLVKNIHHFICVMENSKEFFMTPKVVGFKRDGTEIMLYPRITISARRAQESPRL